MKRTTEQIWDQRLKIDTAGSDMLGSDIYHYPYEPTPYEVLERLAEEGGLSCAHTLVDYGCGKGRVGFFLHRKTGCRVIGVEYNPRIWQQAQDNWKSSGGSDQLTFLCEDAAAYLPETADCFYFFNPFSVEILKSVLGQIMAAYYLAPRPMRLYFYYPSDLYVTHLMSAPELTFRQEINCGDLFPNADDRERILVFDVE